jgi:Transcription-repair coupling factor (superfamily II helicase)
VSLWKLPSLLVEDSGIHKTLEQARDGGSLVIPSGATTATVQALAGMNPVPSVTVVLCATGRESDQLRDELRSVVPEGTHVLDFPAWETLPHERLSPHAETVARRRSALRQIAMADKTPGGLVVVASIRAVVQPVNPDLASFEPWIAAQGDSSRTLEAWVEYLVGAAYVRVDLVTRRGEFALRGGILDVFPPLAEHPIRLDFFGSEIEQLNFFGVADQRSLSEAVGVVVLEPVREMLLTADVRARASQLSGEYPGLGQLLAKVSEGIPTEGMESLQPLLVPGLVAPLSLLPEDALIIEVAAQKVQARAAILLETNREFLRAAWEVAALDGSEAPVDLHAGSFLTHQELKDSVAPRPWVALDSLDTGEVTNLRPPLQSLPLVTTGGEEVWEFIANRIRDRDTVIVVAAGHGLVERSAQVLGERDIPHRIDEELASSPSPGVVSVVRGVLHEGFWAPDSQLVVMTEKELYGKAVSASPRTGRTLATKRTRVVDPLQLSTGDYVVHDTHGVGRFVELVSREISTGGRNAMMSQREFVVLEYAPNKRGGLRIGSLSPPISWINSATTWEAIPQRCPKWAAPIGRPRRAKRAKLCASSRWIS